VSLGVLLLIVAIVVVLRDRKDWLGYAYISLASMYLAATPQGAKITPAVTSFAAWIDALVRGWFT